MKIDLHIHSIYSDGCSTPEQIAARAKAVGMDGFALTDHDENKGWERGRKAADELGIFFVPGKEIMIRQQTRDIKPKKYGEILALFLDEDIKTKPELHNVEEIIDEIHDKNGLVIIPHPMGDEIRKQNITHYVKERKIKIDGIETINGRCDSKTNSRSIEYAIREGLSQTGGSDAHHIREVGTVYTFVDAYSLEDFRKGIKKGLSKPIGIQKTKNEITYNRILCKFNSLFNNSKPNYAKEK
jgi:predicted metal-dependent phosphoesterase TrpH